MASVAEDLQEIGKIMNKQINTFISELKTIFDERLISVILHGSGSIEEINEKKPSCLLSCCLSEKKTYDVNLIVILNKLDASDLKKAYPCISKWKKTGHPLPVFMDRNEWYNSTDIYPIEYSDIKRRHKILHGENIVDNLNVDKCHLRLQCEYELKNSLIKLRETYLGNINHTKFLNHAVRNCSKKLITLFRAVLELTDEVVPHSAIDIIHLMETKVAIDKNLFNILFSDKRKKGDFSKNEIEDIITRLIDSLNLLLKYVDNLDICK